MKICWIKPALWTHSACNFFLFIRRFSVALVVLSALFSTAQADDSERVDVFSQLIEMRKGARALIYFMKSDIPMPSRFLIESIWIYKVAIPMIWSDYRRF